jgi:membrane-bound lytic murein transglycosylase D
MQLRLTSSILCTIVLAGCVAHPISRPVPQPSRSDAGRITAVARTAPDSARAAPTVVPAGAPARPASDSAAVSRTEVARRAVEVFGDSLAIATPASADSGAAEPSWDIDVRSYETQERVAHYVGMFTGRSKERITERLERGTRYEPMIRAKLKAGGLPEDMYYLALVESGFDPHAYSRAAAVGMWQFMTSTARDMGMRVDGWVDERRDPVKSTTAAVRFIRGLRDQFGSLYLAAAAYNGGPGRVARGLARYADDLENTQGDDAFFVLAEKDYLKNETREYVPQLIAAALIAKDPARYGMELHPRSVFAYDSVTVPASTPLAAAAKAARVTTAAVVDLNPHLLRGMTPPRAPFLIRIPTGSAARFDSAFAALPREDRVATHTVESTKGQTAERIARENGVAVGILQAFNPNLQRLKSGRLAPGQTILLPTAAVAAAALSVPDPAIERYPNSTKKMKVHTVTKGETVSGVAKKFGTTSDRIMRLNGLKKPMIFPGQTLIVAGAAASNEKGGRGSAGESRAARAAGTAKEKAAAAKASKGSKMKGASSRKSPSSTKKRASFSKAKGSAKRAAKKNSGAGSKAGARKKTAKTAGTAQTK